LDKGSQVIPVKFDTFGRDRKQSANASGIKTGPSLAAFSNCSRSGPDRLIRHWSLRSIYKRHGTTTLLASLEVATGEVLGKFSPRHGVSDFLDFLKLLNRTYPRRELHLIVDNYHTHKNVLVNQWLSRHPRFHLHFTPTSSSWLNQVEGWFSLLSRRAIRRGVFRSVGQLIEAIQHFIAAWNNKRHPFVWVKTADQILTKANPKATFGSVH
jgi:transposase